VFSFYLSVYLVAFSLSPFWSSSVHLFLHIFFDITVLLIPFTSLYCGLLFSSSPISFSSISSSCSWSAATSLSSSCTSWSCCHLSFGAVHLIHHLLVFHVLYLDLCPAILFIVGVALIDRVPYPVVVLYPLFLFLFADYQLVLCWCCLLQDWVVSWPSRYVWLG